MRLAYIFLCVLGGSVIISSIASWAIVFCTSYGLIHGMAKEFTQIGMQSIDNFDDLLQQLISNSTKVMATITNTGFQLNDIQLNMTERQIRATTLSLLNYTHFATERAQHDVDALVDSFEMFMVDEITKFEDISFGYASRLRSELANQVQVSFSQVVEERARAIERLAQLYRMGTLNLSVFPESPHNDASCSILGALCDSSNELGFKAEVYIATASGAFFSCLSSTGAAMLHKTHNNTAVATWQASSDALLNDGPAYQDRCLHQDPVLTLIPEKCETSPCGFTCSFDPHCRVWYATHVNQSGPPQSKVSEMFFDYMTGVPVVILSNPIYDKPGSSSRQLVGVAAVSFKPGNISQFLGRVQSLAEAVIVVVNDSTLTILGITVGNASCDVEPNDGNVSSWSLLSSCMPEYQTLGNWLLQQRTKQTRSSYILGNTVWDVFPSSVRSLNYFVLVGVDFDKVYGVISASQKEAVERLNIISNEQMAVLSAAALQASKFMQEVENANLEQLRTSQLALRKQLWSLWNTSQLTLNSSRVKGESRLRHLVEAQQEEVNQVERDQLQTLLTNIGWTIAIVLGMLFLLLMISAYGTISVTKSLQLLSNQIHDVAEMRVEPHLDVTVSRVTEVGRIQEAFKRMVTQLAFYKSFMPAALFDNPDHHEEKPCFCPPSDQVHQMCLMSVLPPDTPSSSSAPRARRESWVQRMMNRSGSIAPALGFQEETSIFAIPSPQSGILRTKMVKKTVAVMVVNILNFKANWNRALENFLETFMNQYISHVHEIVFKARGSVDVVVGDQVLVTFNAHIPCSDATNAAAGAALDIQDALNQAWGSNVKTQIGLSAGEVFAGNVGYFPYKTMVTIGPPMKMAGLLAHLLDFSDGAILVDPSIEERVKYAFKLRPVDLVYLPQLGSYASTYARHVRVHLLQCRTQLQEEEWLYQVGQNAAIGDWETTFNVLATSETVEAATRTLQQYIFHNPEDMYAQRLCNRMRDWRPRWGVALCEGSEPVGRLR